MNLQPRASLVFYLMGNPHMCYQSSVHNRFVTPFQFSIRTKRVSLVYVSVNELLICNLFTTQAISFACLWIPVLSSFVVRGDESTAGHCMCAFSFSFRSLEIRNTDMLISITHTLLAAIAYVPLRHQRMITESIEHNDHCNLLCKIE